MARVPRHFRQKLVSSQVGVNTLDTSGAETARAIAGLADTFQQMAVGEIQKQKAATDKSEAAQKQAEYVNRSSVAAQELQKNFAEEPEEGFEALSKRNQEIKDDILGSVSDSTLRADIGASIDGLMAQQSINNKKWQINRMSAMDQQFLVDVQQMNIDTIMRGATADEYEIMLGDDTFTEENYKRAWGPEDGADNFRTAQDAMFRARATKLMEDGRFFDAQDFIESREEPSETTRREVRANFLKMQKGAVAQRFFQTVSAASVDAVETQEGLVFDELTVAQLDDKVLELSALAPETENPQEKDILDQHVRLVADVRDIKMEQILLTASGNTETESRLQASYNQLFRKEDGQFVKNPSTYLSDFLTFQTSVVEEAKAGRVSAANYRKWMFWSKVALQGIELGKRNERVLGIFGNTDLSTRFAAGENARQVMTAFITNNEERSNEWKLNVLQEVYEQIPSGGAEQLTTEAWITFFTNAQRVATLKELGYPLDVMNTKVVTTPAGTFNVIDFDQDGTPVLDVSTQNMER